MLCWTVLHNTHITDDSTPIWIVPHEQNAKTVERGADSHSETGGCNT